ncbi:hypothetical protein KSP39_PZI011759 [Platanthera zijinensis]|uniref:Uncharacterized protein n=1 Tax=Platanthera zijinensis TaxID=2320716 RepID=A0AAP0BF01_9ASPA
MGTTCAKNLLGVLQNLAKFLQTKYKSDIETKGEEESCKEKTRQNQPSLAIRVKRGWTVGWFELLDFR